MPFVRQNSTCKLCDAVYCEDCHADNAKVFMYDIKYPSVIRITLHESAYGVIIKGNVNKSIHAWKNKNPL